MVRTLVCQPDIPRSYPTQVTSCVVYVFLMKFFKKVHFVLGENAKRLQHKHQAFLGHAELNKSLLSGPEGCGSANQQHPSKINIYANNNWKQHLDESGLATLPRRPFSAQSFYPYNFDLEVPYNYNSHLMGGYKMNLSQSPSNVDGLPGTLQR